AEGKVYQRKIFEAVFSSGKGCSFLTTNEGFAQRAQRGFRGQRERSRRDEMTKGKSGFNFYHGGTEEARRSRRTRIRCSRVTRPKKSLQILLLFINRPGANLHFNFSPKIVLHLLLSTEAEISSAEEQLMRNMLIR